MKNNSRFLPRLNLCYLQKKAYENHRLKVCRIKSSLSTRHRHKPLSPYNHISTDTNTQALYTVTQQSRQQIQCRMTPFQRKTVRNAEIQNYRLSKAIRNCPSTISRRQLSQHSLRSEQDKRRIMKFQSDESGEHKILKNKYSLQKIGVNERKKSSVAISRLFAISPMSTKQSNLDLVKINLEKKGQGKPMNKMAEFFSKTPSNKLGQPKKGISRNLRKIKEHFENKPLNLISQQRLQGFRQKSQASQKKMHISQIHKWKTRCFTTQLQSYD